MKQPFGPPCRWWLQTGEAIAARESFLASARTFCSKLDARKQPVGGAKQKRLLKKPQKLGAMSNAAHALFRRLPKSARLSKKAQRQS